MHTTGTVRLGCVDCHGGHAGVTPPTGAQKGSAGYDEAKKKAHPKPSVPELWRSSANPVRPFTEWLKETKEYIQFVNPGDLRVAEQTCGSGGCHAKEVLAVRTSMMTTGAMLWEAALYNNGGFPYKDARFGESYSPDGVAQRVNTYPPPSQELTRTKGVLPHLDPLARWEVSQPGNILRVFERGGGERSEVGIPNTEEDPGRPDVKLSERGLGTELRTDPVFLGLQKTRLLDPILSMPGTNDHPGDYRNSGCTACHVIYANDRSPIHSGPVCPVRQSGAQRRDRSHHSAQRVRPSHQARVHALHPHQPVHRVPHPSRHQHGGVVSRLHLVGQRNRRRAHVSEGAAQSVG